MITFWLLLGFVGGAWGYPQLENRIVNGTNASIRSLAYHVGVEYNGTYICGGCIISLTRIVTAAHCTERDTVNVSRYRVRGATNTVNSGGLLFEVATILQHPQFNSVTFDCDISLLNLNRSLPIFTPGFRIIPTMPKGLEIPDNYSCTVTGWGASVWGGNVTKQLQQVVVPKYNFARCGAAHNISLTDNMVCFGYEQGGKDSCSGDSGGPLVCNGFLGGLVSTGRECALPKYPSIYTKVSNFVDFIYQI